MAPARALAWSLRLLVLLLLRQAVADWIKGTAGDSCDETCVAAGQVCSQDGTRRVDAEFEMQYLMDQNVTDCIADQDGDPFRVVTDSGSFPGRYVAVNTRVLKVL
ncbi:unnamed protein product [Symbiodinium natans]|uniref:Uncharacterized protein n=1 Tax=Symbiodinium natans TaxID=878477 RepID=A0A812QZC3_9DINO|nr:unnamed protein product [Symbiodinium natans]